MKACKHQDTVHICRQSNQNISSTFCNCSSRTNDSSVKSHNMTPDSPRELVGYNRRAKSKLQAHNHPRSD
jgi:hypothetical protein